MGLMYFGRTSISSSGANNASAKTTIPKYITENIQLKNGDKLDWYINGSKEIIVKKVE